MNTHVSEAVLKAREVKYGSDQYRIPYSRELEGKAFEFVFDDGYVLYAEFPLRDTIRFHSSEDSHVFTEEAHVMKADEGAYLVMTEIKNSEPRTGFMLIIDETARLVTGNFVQQGTRADFKNLVTRTLRFGAIKDGEKPLPEARHCFTKDLDGKKIEWTYRPDFAIIHVYLGEDKYTTAFPAFMREVFEKSTEPKPDRVIPDPYWESCIHVKFRENLYMFSFIEENLGSGTEGLMVMNTDRMTDVGCFWGADPFGEREGYMFGAYGRWVNEHIPEDDLLSRIK